MSRIRSVTDEVFSAIVQLRHLDASPSLVPERLSQQMIEIIERMQARARKVGFAHEEVEEIAYAVVATVDELALQKRGPISDYWIQNLLQMRFFDENVAGDVFFARLERLMGAAAQVHNWSDVLRVYFICLSLGFEGRYRVRNIASELIELTARLRELLVDADLAIDLAPSGARPQEERPPLHRNLPLIALALVVLVGAVLLYALLQWRLSDALQRTVQCISAVELKGHHDGVPATCEEGE